MAPNDLVIKVILIISSFFVTFLVMAISTWYLQINLPMIQNTNLGKQLLSSDYIQIPTYNYLKNGTKIEKITKLYKNETLFYADYWRSHWCPYYNDRDFFLSPRINEFLHLARSRGFKVFHLNWKGHEQNLDKNLRSKFKKIVEKTMPDIIKDTWPDNNKNNHKYIPGFQDKCMYPGFERFGKTRCQKPNPSLSVGENDLIAFNFKSIATIAHYYHAKTVILTGIHTNLCIRSAAMYLALLNISVGYIDDLLDAGFYYPTQKDHLQSHSEMNRVTLKFAETHHGWGAISQDVMRELFKLVPTTSEPHWVMYPEAANQFRRFYQ